MFVHEDWKKELWSILFLISQKRARTMLTACWVCSIFSSKNRSLKILSFILSFCEFVQCSTAFAVDWNTSSLCLLPLLLGLGWPLVVLSYCLPATLLFLRVLHFPCWCFSPKSFCLLWPTQWLHFLDLTLSCMAVITYSLAGRLLFAF